MVSMPPPLLLLHGFTHTGASWDGVIAALRERYLALAPDIRGHGSAGELTPVTLGAVLADLTTLASPGPLTVCGYSLGGRIALHLAFALATARSEEEEEPSWCRRLVLIGAGPGIADPGERAARRRSDERLADELEGMTIERFAARWARTPVLADQSADVSRAAHQDRLRNTPAGLARALRGLGAGALPSLWDRLAELDMPVALVVGERDRKFRETAERMAARLPDAELIVVPGAGHAVHLEAPDRVAEAIERR